MRRQARCIVPFLCCFALSNACGDLSKATLTVQAQENPPAQGADSAASTKSPLTFVGSALDQEALLKHLREAKFRSLESVGTTSTVFRMGLIAPIDAAYKPMAKARMRGYRAEVAAYRLARLLGMDNVPPATIRGINKEQLSRSLVSKQFRQLDELVGRIKWNKINWTRGAVIYWIKDLQKLELETPNWTKRWHVWLKPGGAIPGDQRKLAADISSMLAFDYLIGNWDRFSGGNIARNAEATRLYVRDHDAAFAAPLPERLHTRVFDQLRRVQRFSKRFVAAIKALRAEDLHHAFDRGRNMEEGFWLAENELQGVISRLATLKSYIGALIDEHSEHLVCDLP